ncbi:MAG: alpha/beta fold hydrolase [Pseudomonadales bacterium]|nr:alpha/beta fold hydrolase [Pseudomonadales bacterium]
MARSLLFFLLLLHVSDVVGETRECVILLHGLARTADSMVDLKEALTRAGYFVVNVDYPSRHKPVEELADIAVPEGLSQCEENHALPISFVTHSLGGILVRYYYKHHDHDHLKRVVMLGPPNQGSEVVDNLKDMPGFELLNGPAGRQLGTSEEDIPRQLGPVDFELGVIAGTRSINLILSSFLPNPDDGKVSVAATRVRGMCGFVALPATHPFMMGNDRVIQQVIHFLDQGKFEGEEARNYCE